MEIVMTFARLVTCALPALALLTTAAARAQDAPTQLRGRSVVLKWTESRMLRIEGQTDFHAVNAHQTLQLYVSTEGRVFERRSAAVARDGRTRTGAKDSVDGGAIAGRNSTTHFSGRSLVIAGTMGQGGRQVSVEFDGVFSKCTVQVTVGREAGVETIKSQSLTTGQRIEYRPQGISGASCAIRGGNVFAR